MHNVDKRDENSKEDSKTNTRKKIFKCNKNEECFCWAHLQAQPRKESVSLNTLQFRTHETEIEKNEKNRIKHPRSMGKFQNM